MRLNKQELNKIFELIMKNYKDFDISIQVMPEVNEMIDYKGKGERYIKYIRIITIEDKEPIIEKVDKNIW